MKNRKFIVDILETELECRYDDPEFCFEDNESEIRMLEEVLTEWCEFEMIRKWGRLK